VTASEKPRPTEDELWAQLCALPEHLKGEIIDGELFVQPRPRPRHARVIGEVFIRIQRVFDGAGEGHGGWWIDERWLLHATCSEETTVRLPPFEQTELPLSKLWI
jgi:hypothetical protein